MKTIIKIEIVILVIVLLAGAGMVLISEGVLNLLYDPVVVEQDAVPIATDAAAVSISEEQLLEETPEAETPAETISSQPQTQTTTDTRVITAKKYFAYDVREEAFLSKQGDADEKLYPASITKLLTSYVVLQYMKPEEKVVVGDALNLVQPDSSVAGLMEGDTLTVEQLIAAMMLPSGNDAAQVAAVAAGRAIAGKPDMDYEKAVQTFVDEMNKQAAELGMKNSHFVNPDGWHNENHYTTMNDLVLLSKKVLTDQTILKYASRAKDSVLLPARTLEWKNTNHLLHSDASSYLPNTIGLKTGYTDAAGDCLISAFFMEDRLWIIGVFGCKRGDENRYLDTLAIYNSLA